MTLLVVTVTPDCAWLSQDSAISVATDDAVAAMPKRNMIGRRVSSVISYGGAPPQVCAYGGKIYRSEQRRLLIGGAGLGKAYGLLLQAIDESTVANIDALTVELPRLAAQLPTDVQKAPMMIMAVGWSERQQRVVGFAAASDKKFRPIPLPRGHALTPYPVELDEAEAAEITQRWTPAVDGHETAIFHRMVARNCARASRAGEYGNLSVIGGRLQIGIITRENVELREDIDLGGARHGAQGHARPS